MPDHPDPFRTARETEGHLITDFNGERIPFILRHADVRDAAKDWETFSSDHPFKVVPHTEEKLRSVRQLPIETDPPDHSDYRKIVTPLFRRPVQKEYQSDIAKLVESMVEDLLASDQVEAVYGFALPLQCRALTRLLGVPEGESELWISWGVHVFTDGDGEVKGDRLDDYVVSQFERAAENPGGDDFFSVLNEADFRGRKLTMDEKRGFANVAFAGGRDTIINVVASIIAHFSEKPEALEFLREDVSRVPTAVEEFVRYVSPLTAIARSCPHAAKAGGADAPAGSRVALCWPSANRDADVFENPNEIVLDRCPNRHVGFGYGYHTCLGAHHARLLIKTFLRTLCEKVSRIELIDYEDKLEKETSFTRKAGYESLNVRFKGL
jgi:cytochrome P450